MRVFGNNRRGELRNTTASVYREIVIARPMSQFIMGFQLSAEDWQGSESRIVRSICQVQTVRTCPVFGRAEENFLSIRVDRVIC